MKKIEWFLVNSVLIGLLSQVAWSADGHDRGNGGTGLAAHFTQVMINAHQAFADVCRLTRIKEKESGIRQPNKICERRTLQRWATLLTPAKNEADAKFKVFVSEEVYGPEGEARDAVNFPDRMEIRFRENPYRDLAPAQMLSLVVHEFASLLKLDTSDSFQYSGPFIALLGDHFIGPERLIPVLPKRELPDFIRLKPVCFRSAKVCGIWQNALSPWMTNQDVRVEIECRKLLVPSPETCSTEFAALVRISLGSKAKGPTYDLPSVTTFPKDPQGQDIPCERFAKIGAGLNRGVQGAPFVRISCVDGVLQTVLDPGYLSVESWK